MFGEGDRVNLTRMGGLGVAVAASLATIATGLAPAVAHTTAPGGSVPPAVTHYTGTRGVARMAAGSAPAVATPRVLPRGARRLPSGHFSPTEAVPGVSAPAAAAASVAASAASAAAT